VYSIGDAPEQHHLGCHRLKIIDNCTISTAGAGESAADHKVFLNAAPGGTDQRVRPTLSELERKSDFITAWSTDVDLVRITRIGECSVLLKTAPSVAAFDLLMRALRSWDDPQL